MNTRAVCQLPIWAMILVVLLGGEARLAASGGLPAGAAQAQENSDSLTVGRKFQMASKVLGETRDIWVALPAGYEGGQERYPVLIQLGDLSHFRYSVPIVDILARSDHIPAMIVVALPDPTPRHHYRDSTPTAVDYLPASGGAPQFLRFLDEELIPYIEANYRSQPFRILCGHGLSGLFAVYAMLESPGTFGAVLTDGASLTYDNSSILKAAGAKPAGSRLRGSLYLGVGNEVETIPGLQALARLLESKAFPGLEWTLAVEPDEDQGTAAVPAFYGGLKWIFRAWRIPVEAAAKGMDAIRAYYAGLAERFGYDIPVTEKTLAGRGVQLIREQRFEDAEALLKLNVRAYPDSHRVYLSLAFLYERTKDWKRAAAYYGMAADHTGPAEADLGRYFRAQAERLNKR